LCQSWGIKEICNSIIHLHLRWGSSIKIDFNLFLWDYLIYPLQCLSWSIPVKLYLVFTPLIVMVSSYKVETCLHATDCLALRCLLCLHNWQPRCLPAWSPVATPLMTASLRVMLAACSLRKANYSGRPEYSRVIPLLKEHWDMELCSYARNTILWPISLITDNLLLVLPSRSLIYLRCSLYILKVMLCYSVCLDVRHIFGAHDKILLLSDS
jgi:hypothetical protein